MTKYEFFALFAAAVVSLAFIQWAMRKRRRTLAEFERAVRDPRAQIEVALEYGDTAPTVTKWKIVGKVGEGEFTFEATEMRSASQRRTLFTLTIGPVEGRNPGTSFGGECHDSDADQATLSTLFGKLWPVGNYPRPAAG